MTHILVAEADELITEPAPNGPQIRLPQEVQHEEAGIARTLERLANLQQRCGEALVLRGVTTKAAPGTLVGSTGRVATYAELP